jgi:hypothetical protein
MPAIIEFEIYGPPLFFLANIMIKCTKLSRINAVALSGGGVRIRGPGGGYK